MSSLLLKELRLNVHPATYAMVALGALALIPSWMYGAIFVYGILAAFFNGINAREMRDLDYTFALPVSRAAMVRTRVSVMVMVEAAMLAIMTVCIALRGPLGIDGVAAAQGPVGTAANLYLVGFGLMVFGLFNVVFYPLYYRNPRRWASRSSSPASPPRSPSSPWRCCLTCRSRASPPWALRASAA